MRMLFCLQERRDLGIPERVLLRHHLVRDAFDRFKRLRRTHPVGSDVARFARDLLLDAGDANLEKFIEIRADDPEKLDPLEQRLGRVLRFLEDAAIELEPAQLAVDEIFRGGKIGLRRRFVRRGHRHDVVRRRGKLQGWRWMALVERCARHIRGGRVTNSRPPCSANRARHQTGTDPRRTSHKSGTASLGSVVRLFAPTGLRSVAKLFLRLSS